MNNFEKSPQAIQPEDRSKSLNFAITSSQAMIAAALLSASALAYGANGCMLPRGGTNIFPDDTSQAGMGGSGLTGGNESGGNGGAGNTGGIGGSLTGGNGGNGGSGLEGGNGGTGGEACVPTTEVCDGIDNDCDKSVDEDDPSLGDTCNTGNKGECKDGTKICDQIQGKLVCSQTNQPQTEICSGGKDEDCDGLVDCDDPSCKGDPACGSIVTFMDTNNCYKNVKFFKGTTIPDPAESTTDDNFCSSGLTKGFYVAGDTAMVWQDKPLPGSTLVFTSTTPPVSIQDKCSASIGTPPNWAYSTMALQSGGYKASTFTANGQQFTVTLSACVKDYYDIRIGF